ncbi:MAG: DNA alkylation repair protein [Clostridia bacterium]|nr:DNA alkylation repair protein [Clostridia bacterium]
MEETQLSISRRLFALQDKEYAAFSAKLIPNIAPESIIGVRLPALRALAKELTGTKQAKAFLHTLPHLYLEEYHLHSFLIAKEKDFEECIRQVERFLPYIDNWATCDSLRPACFKRNKEALLPYIEKWLRSEHLYTVRFAIGMLMCHYLDEAFEPVYLQWVAAIHREEYYLNMMRAWYFATAAAKQYEATAALIQSKTLDAFTQNKAIQKAVESFRVTPEHKEQFKKYKIK